MAYPLLAGLFLILAVLYIYVNLDWFPDWALFFILIGLVPVFVKTQFDLVIFSLTAVLGYISEWIGVKTKIWEYHKKDTPFWVALAWGFTVVFIYYSSQIVITTNWTFFAVLVLFSVIIDKYEGSLRINPLMILNMVLALLINSNNLGLLVSAYFFAHFVEFFGARFFKAWVYYGKLSFLMVGFSYILFAWMITTAARAIVGIKSLFLWEMGVLIFFPLSVILSRAFSKQLKKYEIYLN